MSPRIQCSFVIAAAVTCSGLLLCWPHKTQNWYAGASFSPGGAWTEQLAYRETRVGLLPYLKIQERPGPPGITAGLLPSMPGNSRTFSIDALAAYFTAAFLSVFWLVALWLVRRARRSALGLVSGAPKQ